LCGQLLIGIAPGADFQAAADPAQIFIVAVCQNSVGSARGTANCAWPLRFAPFRIDRLLCQL
jgi:hypothetical protein